MSPPSELHRLSKTKRSLEQDDFFKNPWAYRTIFDVWCGDPSLRASLRGLVLDDPGDLARMMQKVNRLVYESSSSSRYATFFFAVLHPETREFRYVNAGHNPPVLVNGASGAIQRLEACGPVVGLLPFADYEACSLTLKPGDLLIAYTDGISEAMTSEDEEWGEGRMLRAVPRQPVPSAEEVLDNIFRAADAFTAGAEQHDDMTLLVMKVTASSTSLLSPASL